MKYMATVLRKRGWFSFMSTVAMLLVLGALTVMAAMPSTTVWNRDGGPVRTALLQVFPQNWAFFTKDPRSVHINPYLVTQDGFIDANAGPQSEPSNWFGLSRSQRSQGTEVAILSQAFERKLWADCDHQSTAQCLTAGEQQNPVTVENEYQSPTVCGDVLLLVSRTAPWSYRTSDTDGEVENESVVHLEVKCAKEE